MEKRSNCKPIETQKHMEMTQMEPKTGKIENIYGLKYWTNPVRRVKEKNNTDETLMAVSDDSVRRMVHKEAHGHGLQLNMTNRETELL